MSETQQIAAFVAATRYESLTRELVDEFKILVLDALAAGFVGSHQPWSQTVNELVRELGGSPQATVIGQSWRTDIARAALANGTMIGAFECEPLTGSHAAGTVFPAALAVAEHHHLTGRELLVALVVGAEVAARLMRSSVGLESERGFHNPSAQGPFGAAMAVGKLLAFDERQLVHALGLAGSAAGGLGEFAWEGADTKRMHLGRASQLGLESALLSEGGLTGPSTVLEGRFGYFNAFSLPGADLDQLVDGLGECWAVQPPFHKSFATHASHQSVVQAIQDFKAEQPFELAALSAVTVHGSGRMLEARHQIRDPVNVMGAQYSLPFAIAVALARDASDPLALTNETVADAVVRRIAAEVTLLPADGEVTVTLELEGEQHVLFAQPFKGSPQNPMRWDDVCEKFDRYAAGSLGEQGRAEIIEAVGSLEDAADVAVLARQLAAQ
jgi:2-methylcitrate dehydratase PrpD